MKAIVNRARKLLEAIEHEGEKRQQRFSERSWQWQQSERGEAYEELTDLLENLESEIDMFIQEYEELAA